MTIYLKPWHGLGSHYMQLIDMRTLNVFNRSKEARKGNEEI